MIGTIARIRRHPHVLELFLFGEGRADERDLVAPTQIGISISCFLMIRRLLATQIFHSQKRQVSAILHTASPHTTLQENRGTLWLRCGPVSLTKLN